MKNKNFFPVFLLFFILSLSIFFVSLHSNFFSENFVGTLLFSVQGKVFGVISFPKIFSQNTEIDRLQNENLALKSQLVHMQQLQADNTALQDQFQTTTLPSSSLLPAQIIGDPSFIPGVTAPEVLIINRGKEDGVGVGNIVVYQTNIVGSVVQIENHTSLLQLVTNKATSFTATTSKTDAQGVLTGQGNGGMIFGNVLLSNVLQVGDMVVTTGSKDMNGNGIAPGLIVGKIISVSKNPSSLYQSASVQSLLPFEKLSTVFVMINK